MALRQARRSAACLTIFSLLSVMLSTATGFRGIAATSILGAVALASAFVPAWRTARLAPMNALRTE